MNVFYMEADCSIENIDIWHRCKTTVTYLYSGSLAYQEHPMIEFKITYLGTNEINQLILFIFKSEYNSLVGTKVKLPAFLLNL